MYNLTVVGLGICNYADGFDETDIIYCDLGGVKGDKHNGQFTTLGVQEFERLKKMGIEGVSRQDYVANGRQVTAITQEDMADIAKSLQVDIEHVGIAQLRANIMFTMNEEIFGFSNLIQGSYIVFQGNGRAILEVHYQNFPCVVAGKNIEDSSKRAGVTNKFPKAAYGKRGLCLTVFRPGKIVVGDKATSHLPRY